MKQNSSKSPGIKSVLDTLYGREFLDLQSRSSFEDVREEAKRVLTHLDDK